MPTQEELVDIIARGGSKDEVKALIEKQPNLLEEKDQYGRTPLLHAALFGNKATVEALIESKANLNAKAYGIGVIYYAMINKTEDATAIIKLLAEKQPNLLEEKDQCNRTPLLHAALFGNKATVEALIENNANIYAKGESGDNVLHYAAANQTEDAAAIFKLLTERWPDLLKEKNANGDLPLSGSKADGSEQDSANKVIPAVPIEAMEKKRLLLKGYMEESIMETKDIPLKVSRAAPSSSASLQAVSAVSNSHNQQHSL